MCAAQSVNTACAAADGPGPPPPPPAAAAETPPPQDGFVSVADPSGCRHMSPTSLAYAALAFNRDNGFTGKNYAMGTALFYLAFMFCMVGGRCGWEWAAACKSGQGSRASGVLSTVLVVRSRG